MKLVALLMAVLIGSCASVPFSSANLRGCWIERGADGAVSTMRWFPERGGWRGDELIYLPDHETAHQAFRLERDGAGWRLCPLDEPHGPPCRPVASGGLDYFARVEASVERLRLSFVDEGEALVLFDGVRDGCD